MRIDDNKEALAMMRRTLGSLEGKIREAYNKGYQDGVKEGVNRTTQKMVDKILEEVEDEPQTDCDLALEWNCSFNACEYYDYENFSCKRPPQTDCAWK